MQLKGTHGTCVSAADEIKKSGFNPHQGRRGTGVYFWAYGDGTRQVARALSYAWWNFCNSKGRFRSKENSSYICLDVDLKTEKLLDLEVHDIKHALLKFVHEASMRAANQRRNYLSKNAYDLFVQKLEEQAGEFDVIHVTVNPPAKEYFSENDRRNGHVILEDMCPSCYVVKNSNCIEIK